MSTDPALLRTVADRQEIMLLLGRIAQLADHGDVEDYLDCFTADAVWDLVHATGLPLEAGPISGREALREGVRERRAAGIQGPGSATRHDVSTITVEVSGDTARSRAYFRYYRETDATPVLTAMGGYDDEFVRTPAGWRVRRRVIRRE